MGTYRASLDYLSALIKDLDSDVPPENMSEKELILRRRRALNGGKISCLDPTRANGDDGVKLRPRAEELRRYLKRRRWGRVLRTCKLPLDLFAAIAAALVMIMVPAPIAHHILCAIVGCGLPDTPSGD